MSEKIRCFVEKVIFRNSENHFTVISVNSDKYPTFIAAGYLDDVSEELEIIIEGKWTTHKKYGKQFAITKYERVFSDNQAIIDFLVKLKLPGIGISTAEKIVKEFGEKTFEIFDNDIERLNEIKKFKDSALEEIKKIWKEKSILKKLYFFLYEHRLPSSLATKIFSVFGENSIDIIKENPYVLAQEIIGIGFKTADEIALKLGFPEDSPLRLQALINYLIYESSNAGNVFLWYYQTYQEAIKYVTLTLEEFEKLILDIEAKNLVILERNFITEKAAEYGYPIYLRSFYKAEKNIANDIAWRIKNERKKNISDKPYNSTSQKKISKIIEEIQNELKIQFNQDQKAAIEKSLNSNLFILTGGPGTGKTTVVKALVEFFLRHKKRIALCAPTGRASKVLSEAANFEAQTIHRLLEYDPFSGGFLRNVNSKLDIDVIIIDEFSMVDIFLFSSLLEALDKKTKIILIGDHYQLPSVGPGNLLRDLLSIEEISKVELKQIYRQNQNSGIIINAHKIKNGELWNFEEETYADFFFIESQENENTLNFILDLISKELPKKYGIDPLNDIQVLTPMKKGLFGAQNLNILLRQLLNKNYEAYKKNLNIINFIEGDKIMQVKNDYEKGVFNGDIGFVKKIDYENNKLFAVFDDSLVEYNFSELENIQLAYASTIHKSQGSEYKAVIITLFASHYPLLQRNLIYTAVTRGKKYAYIIGSKSALVRAINNDKPSNRNSLLKERIIKQLL